MNNADNVDRFIAIYNELDHYLRNLLHRREWVSFKELVITASKFHRVVRKYREDLLQIADLRNILVHSFTGKAIAEPTDYAIKIANRIKDLIISPPTVIPKFEKEVITVQSNEKIKDVIKRMKQNDFSKFPVYNGNHFIGLLTAETVVRWLATSMSINNTAAKEVISYAKHKDNYTFISKDTDLFQIAETFEIYHRNGKRLDAIIITNSGKMDELPIGIITIYDIGEVYKAIEIREIDKL